MGASLTKQEEEIVSLSQYNPIENIRDGHYGEIQLMKSIKTQQVVAVKEAVSQNPEDIDRQAALLKAKKDKPHPNLISVFDLQVNNEDRLCSSVKRLVWIMEYINRDLTVEIRGRRLQQKDFSEDEIWKIAESCISGLSYLQQLNIYHGDLRSSAIFITSEFSIKISDPSLFNITPAYINCMSNGQKRGVYLSPQLLQACRDKNWQPVYDKYKSDVFTLGVILLETILLKHIDEAFDYDKGKVKTEILENYLSLVQQKQYSEKVIGLIRSMLHIDENQRPSFIDLAQKFEIQTDCIDNQIEYPKNGKINNNCQNPEIFKDITNKSNVNNSQQKDNYEDHLQMHGKGQLTTQNMVQSKISVMEKIAQDQQGKKEVGNKQQPNRLGISIHKSDQDDIRNENGNILQKENRLLTPQQSSEKLKSSETNNNGNNNYNQKLEDQQQPEIVQKSHQLDSSPLAQKQQEIKSDVTQIVVNESVNAPLSQQQQYVNQSTNLNRQNVKEEIENLKKIYLQNSNTQTQPQQQGGVTNLPTKQIDLQPNYQVNSSQNCNYPTLGNINLDQYTLQGQKQQNQKQQQYQPRVSTHQNTNPVVDQKKDIIPINYQDNANTTYQEILQDPTLEYKIPDSIQKIIDEFKHKRTNSGQFGQAFPQQSQQQVQETQINAQVQQQNPQQSFQQKYMQLQQQSQLQQQYQQQQQVLQQQMLNQANQLVNYQSYQIQEQESIQQNNTQEINNKMQDIQVVKQNQINEVNGIGSCYSDNFEAEQIKICQQLRQNQQQQYQQQYNEQLQEEALQFQQQYDGNVNQEYQPQLPQQIYDNIDQEEQFNDQKYCSQQIYERIQETYEDGSIYDGEKLNSMRHGQGKFFYADGGFYDGEWRFGRMEGLGTLYYPSGGLAYLGQWKDDKFNGKGTVFNESPQQIQETFDFTNFDQLGEYWVKYEGDFVDDNKEGQGTLVLSNGDKFVGSFSNDLVHGQGSYFNIQGEAIAKGLWDQNRLVN